ncbi:hypothetical protein [Parasphingopyxis marina]|uniref:Uncharacterized protein n=1 Tax=Parasphingopyxis marina TaxID=2761622 RepID=A0A842HXM6_9SPHN|nr:hypothetical protein [Parasphingopyxis marina]MBC2777069.1 hypothetical protein [Parasphingopyxis marina]
MTKMKQGKQDRVTKAGAVELDENALNQVSAGASEVVKIPGPPMPFIPSPLPQQDGSDQAVTLDGHELTHVQQSKGGARKKN